MKLFTRLFALCAALFFGTILQGSDASRKPEEYSSTSAEEKSPRADSPRAAKAFMKRLLALSSDGEATDLNNPEHIARYRKKYLPPYVTAFEANTASEALKDRTHPYASFLVATYRLTSSFAYSTPSFEEWFPAEIDKTKAESPLVKIQQLADHTGLPEAWLLLAKIYEKLSAEQSDNWFDEKAYKRHREQWERQIDTQAEAEKLRHQFKEEEKWAEWYANAYLTRRPRLPK